MKYLQKTLPHACIIMAGMMIVFFCIDRVNVPMGFMSNEFHKWLSLLLSVSCLTYSVMTISNQRRRERYLAKKREQKKTNPAQRKKPDVPKTKAAEAKNI